MAEGQPKTELVYLHDMSRRRDEARAIKVVAEKRTHAYFILDRTIFHPKGGGQPSDHGTIRGSGFGVTIKKAIQYRGVVLHWGKLIEGTPVPGPITSELDWEFRYLVMRRHTAAHLLDHCLAATTGQRVQTTDSWLDEPCYVGYAGPPPNQQTLAKVEAMADQMISSGGPVKIDFLTQEESGKLLQTAPNYERLPDLEEVRIVTIRGCDPIPCGGTHVSDISEIRKMSVLRAEALPTQSFRLHFSVG
jgi:alanyl-tRNA synthetase